MPPENDFDLGDIQVNTNIPGAAVEAAGAIIEQAPEVSEHAIAQHLEQQQQQQQEASASVELDSAGTPFDNNIHSGSKLANGTWRRRRKPLSEQSRAAGSRVGGVTRKPQASDAPSTEQLNEQRIAQARAAGVAAAHTTFLLGSIVGGEEWKPKNEPVNEREMMESAYGDYFVAKGVTDFPPGVALMVALTMYAAPRFTQPVTQQRARSLKNWFVLRIAKSRVKRALKKRGILNAKVTIENGEVLVNGARADFRDDGKRQDDTSAQPSGSI